MIVRAEVTGKIVQSHQVKANVPDTATTEDIRSALEKAARLLLNEDLCNLEGSDFAITLDEIEEERATSMQPTLDQFLIDAGMDVLEHPHRWP